MKRANLDPKQFLLQSLAGFLFGIAVSGCCTTSISAQSFQPAINLSSNLGGDVEDEQIAVSGNTIYVVWSDTISGNFEVLLRRSTDGGATWGATQNLSQTPITSRNPQIAVSGSNVYVTWSDYTDFNGEQHILFRRSTDGGVTFSPTQEVSQPPVTRNCFPSVASSLSNSYVLWNDCSFTGGVGPFFRRSNDTGLTFGSIQNPVPHGNTVAIAVDGSTVYLAWTTSGTLSAPSTVTFTRSVDGGVTFEQPHQLSPDGAGNVKLAVSGSNIYLAWIKPASSPFTYAFARSTDGGVSFAPSVNIATNVQVGWEPQIAVSGQRVFYVWMDNLGVFFRRSVDAGATFEATIPIRTTTSPVSFMPRLAASGDVVSVVWQDCIESQCHGDVLFRSSRDAGATFDAQVNLSADNSSGLPQLAMSGSNVYVIWLKSHFNVFFRRTNPVPVLLAEDTGHAVALDSVTMVRDPLPIITSLNFSSDHRTRVMLFATNADLLPGETSSVVTAQAEDSQHRIFALPVEFVGKVPGFDWLTEVVVKLPDELTNAGDVQVSIALRGVASNKALLTIQPSGN